MHLPFHVLPSTHQHHSVCSLSLANRSRNNLKLRLKLAGGFVGLLSLLVPLNGSAQVVLPSPVLPSIASIQPAIAARKLQFFTLQSQEPWLQVNQFSQTTRATPLNLWATYYHIHRATAIATGEPLLAPNGRSLGPQLSHRDWCQAALQGTIQVLHLGNLVTYNFGGRGNSPQTDCSPYFTRLSSDVIDKMNRVRFVVSSAPYGYGTEKLKLVPYRTIAVDRTRIPIGSVIFIPAARNQLVTLPSGDRVYHDGFFFAGDVGSAIQGNQIDVFLGPSKQNPFPFIASKASKPFQAFLIQDPDITNALMLLHRNVGNF